MLGDAFLYHLSPIGYTDTFPLKIVSPASGAKRLDEHVQPSPAHATRVGRCMHGVRRLYPRCRPPWQAQGRRDGGGGV